MERENMGMRAIATCLAHNSVILFDQTYSYCFPQIIISIPISTTSPAV